MSHAGAIDLRLDANEGQPIIELPALLTSLNSGTMRRYPDSSGLRALLAAHWKVDGNRVLVTAGADDAIDRACRAFLGPGREIIAPSPTFEMIPRYALVAGARVVSPPWTGGAFPVDEVLAAVNSSIAMIAVVSPNNPTGAVATAADLRLLAEGAPNATLLVDLAYAEFADEDLTQAALALPNAIVLRTFSKAFGLAGLRIGYAISGESNIRRLASVGAPYPVSSIGLAAARESLVAAPAQLPPKVARVLEERAKLIEFLRSLGASPLPSQGNFVLCNFPNAEWAWNALAGLGIAVRRFRDRPGLEHALRITCPGDSADFSRLLAALRSTLKPKALLLDIDGVIADVGSSYREAICQTAGSFGVQVTRADISAAKAEGNANNDWVLTKRLLDKAGIGTTLAEVTKRFESFYQGSDASPGLRENERLIPDRALLQRLAAKLPLAAVTGRPRADFERFLDRFDLRSIFSASVCMEDATAKPDPAPVLLALSRLGVSNAWMVGDTPDDILAARAAGVVPLGVLAPGDTNPRTAVALEGAGIARILSSLSALEDLIP
jgi:histidinol-phosphate aminotransferase